MREEGRSGGLCYLRRGPCPNPSRSPAVLTPAWVPQLLVPPGSIARVPFHALGKSLQLILSYLVVISKMLKGRRQRNGSLIMGWGGGI